MARSPHFVFPFFRLAACRAFFARYGAGLAVSLLAWGATAIPTARAQEPTPLQALPAEGAAPEHLLFCNDPEKIRAGGIYADTQLTGDHIYTIFYHYKNATKSTGDLVIALQGKAGEPLAFTARKGMADPQRDPSLAGRQAMARFLSGAEKDFVGAKGGARFSTRLKRQQIASGVFTVRCKSDARLLIYYRHSKWSVPGARVVAVDAPRREVAVSLTAGTARQTFRIGQPETGMSRHLDGTYGMLYAFRVDAPIGSRVRVSFSPRGGKAGMVGSINGVLRQTSIAPGRSWKIFCEAIIGSDGMILTTAPFGGVFYPVELVFQLM